MKKQYFIIGLLLFTACTVDRNSVIPTIDNGPGGNENIMQGTLLINEFEARDSKFYNELVLPGNIEGGSDWIEIYNTTSDTITLEQGKWFLTDSLVNPNLFELPEYKINPKDFLLIWCDDKDTTISQIHCNFSLNKNGEEIGLYYKNAKNNFQLIDGFKFLSQNDEGSSGRFPDGSENPETFNLPTPGCTNIK